MSKLEHLRNNLSKMLGENGSGTNFSDFNPETGLDELFTRLNIIYHNEKNQFLRAELAEHEIKRILLRGDEILFRDDPENSTGQGDIDFFWNGEWNPISIKYKGPDAPRNVPKAPTRSTTLSALQWRKKKDEDDNILATCPMIIIWDTNKATPGQKKKGNPFDLEKGICIIDHDEFNKNLSELGLGEGNQPYAFQLKIIEEFLCTQNPEERWIRPNNREIEIPQKCSEYTWDIKIIHKK